MRVERCREHETVRQRFCGEEDDVGDEKQRDRSEIRFSPPLEERHGQRPGRRNQAAKTAQQPAIDVGEGLERLLEQSA